MLHPTTKNLQFSASDSHILNSTRSKRKETATLSARPAPLLAHACAADARDARAARTKGPAAPTALQAAVQARPSSLGAPPRAPPMRAALRARAPRAIAPTRASPAAVHRHPRRPRRAPVARVDAQAAQPQPVDRVGRQVALGGEEPRGRLADDFTRARRVRLRQRSAARVGDKARLADSDRTQPVRLWIAKDGAWLRDGVWRWPAARPAPQR
eukprot:6206068-Pleurochrysis_carterae.AAC.3